MRKNIFRQVLFVVILFSFSLQNGLAQPDSASVAELFGYLNLENKDISNIKNYQNDPVRASKELLEYYKNRSTVKHLIKRTSSPDNKKEDISEKELKYANDALEHIFVGQTAYESFFAGEDIDWGLRPVPDNEWVWQFNRMYFWNAMGKVYATTGDEKYAKEWSKQLIDWVNKNPLNDEHKYAWRSLEAGIRGYSWSGLFQRFIDSPNFTPEVLVAFLNSLYEHAEYLMTVYTTKSNWSLIEAEGLAFIAITFPEFKNAEVWRKEAIKRLNKEIDIQVYPDGFQIELAMGYHIGCIPLFLRTYNLARLNHLEDKFPKSYLERVEKMCEVPMKLCLPDGTNVQFGDAWRGNPGQHNDKFLQWAEIFKRDDFLFLATDGEKGNKPKQTAFALEESGLYSMRSTWDKDAICMIMKCGPNGGWHCQPDNGTFVVYAGGRNLTPDAGSFIYSGDRENRRWFRQTKVHQTLTLNGQNSKYNPKLLKWETSEDLDILVVENQSYDSLAHRRSVFFVDKRYFVVVDEAIGAAVGDIDIHFQLAPGNAVFNSDDLSVRTDFDSGWNIFVKTNKQEEIQMAEEEGQVSFIYSKKQSRPAFRYRIHKGIGEQPVRFVTLVVPYQQEIPNIKIKENKPKIDESRFRLQIKEGRNKKIIGYSL